MNRSRKDMIKAAVDAQANDPALWLEAMSIGEAYLQQALRNLHAVIEDGDEDALSRIIDCMECAK